MRKLICLLLCMMLLSLSLPAFAEDTVLPVEEGETTQQEGSTGESEVTPPEETGTAPEIQPPHEHSWTVTGDTATCTAAGTKTYSCGCGETRTEESAAKGHSMDAGTVLKEATCTESGTKIFSCTVCGHTYEETIPASGHSYGQWEDDESTDSHYRTCKKCSKTESGKHTWDAGTVIAKPTCKDTGKKIYACSGCDWVIEETLATLTTHTYDSACDKDCNVCGKIRETQHTYTVVWSKNYEGHWHECTKCGDQKDYAKHIAGPAATEAKDQVCLTCNYVITPKKNHTHSYETKWSNDEVGHWYACKTCDSEKDYSAHIFDNACDPDCNVCDYKKETGHTYNDPWKSNEKEHWNICSVCKEETKHEKHVPGAEATDEAAQLCTVCGYEIAPMLEHTHDFGNAWVQTQDSHWQECKCGELSVPESHIWDHGKENRDNTVTYTCTVCGMEKTEESSGGFPWIMVILGLLALICAGGIVAIVIILKRGDFDEEESDEENENPDEEDADFLTVIRGLFHK